MGGYVCHWKSQGPSLHKHAVNTLPQVAFGGWLVAQLRKPCFVASHRGALRAGKRAYRMICFSWLPSCALLWARWSAQRPSDGVAGPLSGGSLRNLQPPVLPQNCHHDCSPAGTSIPCGHGTSIPLIFFNST